MGIGRAGLRRPDGVVVASLLRRRRPGLLRVAGPLAYGKAGRPVIGDLGITNADRALVGQRVYVEGTLESGALAASGIVTEVSALRQLGVRDFSLEAYASAGRAGLRLGSGLVVTDKDASIVPNRPERVILAVTVDANGSFLVQAVRPANESETSVTTRTRGSDAKASKTSGGGSKGRR